MTKKEIAKAVAAATGLTDGKAGEVVQATLDIVKAEMIHGRRIELRGFGVFDVVTRSSRMARNPRTGDKVQVPSKKAVRFAPSGELNTALGTVAEAAQ